MVTYRLANRNDFERIALLHAQSWQQNYRGTFSDHFLDEEVHADRHAVWKKRLTLPADNQFTMVAESEGKLLGFVCAFLDEDIVYGTLIDNLHVSADAQGKGIGKELIRKVAARCMESHSDSKLYLWVLEANVQAYEFYKHFGAKHVETTKGDEIGDKAVPICRMVWEAPETLIS